jgi:hypothetical protein
MPKSNERWWAAAGPVFAVLFCVAVFALEPSTPGDKASAATVIDYFNGHKGRTLADVFLAPLLVALLFVFIAYLRTRAREYEHTVTSRLAPVVLVMGAVAWASGALLGSVTSLTLVTASDHAQPEVAVTVNVLANNAWIPFIAGLAVTLIGAGLTVLSTGLLPRWLGWVALVAGVISLAGPGGFVGFFVGPLWLLVAGVLLFLRPSASVPAARSGVEDVSPVSSPTAASQT